MKTIVRFGALDGLRGYAALSVVIYHAILAFIANRAGALLNTEVWTLSGQDQIARIVLALTSGETAVMVFFVLSGFVLMKSLESEAVTSGALAAAGLFPIRRLLRIYPALVVCMTGMYVLYKTFHVAFPAVYPDPSIRDTLVNAALFEVNVHGASWTLKVEMLAIPFILAAFTLKRVLGIFAYVIALSYSLLLLDIPRMSLSVWLLPSWLMYFVAGFIAYELIGSSTVRKLMKGWRWAVVFACMILLRPLVSMQSRIAVLIQLLCITLIVADLASNGETPLARFLTHRVSRFFGRISYSLYLWNVAILNLLLLPAGRIDWVNRHFLLAGIVIGVVTIALTIPLSIISERWTERPFLVRSRRPPPATLASHTSQPLESHADAPTQ
jgi:peptidoglycan/LPS O-acetylase OafA/YrhL